MRFVFAFFWSIGGSLHISSERKQFDLFAKRLFGKDIVIPDKECKKISLPERGTLYDYLFKSDWSLWTDEIVMEEISAKKRLNEIIVPTTDTVRYSFLLKLNIFSEIPTLFCGPTGTGKSTYIKNLLMNEL